MTIDLSSLSPEKRVFLKAYPNFLRGLKVKAETQAKQIKVRKNKLSKINSHHQREMLKLNDLLDRYRFYLDPNLRKIQGQYVKATGGFVKGRPNLTCPVCGDSDQGNRLNGKPWCPKCKAYLLPKPKIEKWLKRRGSR